MYVLLFGAIDRDERPGPTSHTERNIIMSRFVAWLAIAVAAAFLVVASQSFPLATIRWLAFGIGVATLILAAGFAYVDATRLPSLIIALPIAAISAWTVVASLVFAQDTVQHLTLGASLAICALALAGLTEHEVRLERAVRSTASSPSG
jgi:hypothetical protein